jgi:hypothetical protein
MGTRLSEVVGSALLVLGACGVLAACSDSDASRDAGAGGSMPAGPLDDEVVAVSPSGVRYYVDRTEVTRAAYASWLWTGPGLGGQPDACSENDDYTPTCDWPADSDDQHPVVCVDWCDAHEYCRRNGKRLCGRIGGGSNTYQEYHDPNVDQWYSACSSGAVDEYPYGSPYEPHRCNGAMHGRDATAPVASMAGCVSGTGAFDMSGNVREWKDGCETNTASTAYDYCRVGGGSFRDGELRHLTCESPGQDAFRTGHWDSIGFRCCRDAPADDPGGGAGGAATSEDACNDCLATACPTEDAACLANEACILLFDCMAKCFTAECVADCEAAHPAGVVAYDDSTRCFAESCGASCGFE